MVEAVDMKNVTYLKRDLTGNKGRAVSVRESLASKECDSRVVKNYIYLVNSMDMIPDETPSAQIYVTKRINTETQQENFRFKVKGAIYIKKNRFIYRVDYAHSLLIRIIHKTHVLSTQGPAALA
ncbi:MAG: hypothetical protein HQL18_01195 [Candidatus Omnitrophica bacterium]|nr:hypothetical protein [Candidatus Omnitrophota bacterium]